MESNTSSKIMLLLSEDIEDGDRRRVFLERVLDNASEGSMDSYDICIVCVVGCSFKRNSKLLNNPFKDACNLSTTELRACKDRVLYIIDKVDPHIIIASGVPASKMLGIKSGFLKMFNTKEIREVPIQGHLIKINRPVMNIPTFNWLSQNFSRDPEGPTANAVHSFRKAIEYSNIFKDIIGENNE